MAQTDIEFHSDNPPDPAAMQQELTNLLQKGAADVLFQPVVSLRDGAVWGYEAFLQGASRPLPPIRLLDAAEACGKLWEVGQICRASALSSFGRQGTHAKLFLPVDAAVFCGRRLLQELSADSLTRFGLMPEDICIELLQDSAAFETEAAVAASALFRQRHFRIAVGSLGGAHSNLSLVAGLHPHFIKLHAEITRHIDRDSYRQALVRSVCEFCRTTDISLMAEGAAAQEEVSALIDMGVHYAQGPFICPPRDAAGAVSADVLLSIRDRNKKKNHMLFHSLSDVYIGNVCSVSATAPPEALGEDVYEVLLRDSSLPEITVVGEDERVEGLVTKTHIDHMMSGQFGYSLHARRPISLIMDKNPLVVEYATPIDTVSQIAMSRPANRLYDCIIVTRDGKYAGIVTIKTLLEKTMEIEVSNARHLNPLTGLPGNRMIEQHLGRLCTSNGEPYTILYIDIDNFKAYNDVYGFEKGDGIIAMLAEVMQQCIPSQYFIGHVGGDDFVAILKTYEVQDICQNLIDLFDRNVLEFYTQEDRACGYIIAKSRKNEEEQFPIMGISVAGVSNRRHSFCDVCELAEYAGAVKKRCKQQWSSCYLIDD